MKKAYVKPVFLAEEFVAAASVATCPYKPNSEVNPALDLIDFMTPIHGNKYPSICTKDDGHSIMSGELGKNQKLLDYAYGTADGGDGKATLFDTSGVVCDFVWMKPANGQDVIKVWGDGTTTNDIPNLVANPTKRSTLVDWLVNTTQSFMEFFAGCSATDQQHGLDYEVFSFNS